MSASVIICNADTMGPETLYHSVAVAGLQEIIANERLTKRFNCPAIGQDCGQQSIPLKRRSPTCLLRDPSMPVQTTSQSLLASLPSFMSVFGDSVDVRRDTVAGVTTDSSSVATNITKGRPSYSNHLHSQHFRRDSASTFESTESSPTTTISTLDTSIGDPSPSSSPESPTSLLPNSSLRFSRTNTPLSEEVIMEQVNRPPNAFPMFPSLQMDSPNKKVRNSKNLFLNTGMSARQMPELSNLALSSLSPVKSFHTPSSPMTPAFIVPPKPPNRRQSNLGLSIATSDSAAPSESIQNGSNEVASPSSNFQTSTVSYLQSAPRLSLFSPTVAPVGGMQLPPFGKPSVSGRFAKSRPPLMLSQHRSYDSAYSSAPAVQTLEHVQEENDYELPLSREAKSPSYPQGPVCIYEPYVFLYLEPNHTEALEFDVILNVAREVKNPFSTSSDGPAGLRMKEAAVQTSFDEATTRLGIRNSVSEPQTAVSEKSFRSAFDIQADNGIQTNPTSPKSDRPTPEYVHIPWDHNTNVVDELFGLCELIDDRVQQGKRVLVHCQCGVSRSASLVVAYGLYKNSQLSVQEAYDAVKDRSRWIGPNMNLIYQLSEFRSQLPQIKTAASSNWRSWRPLMHGRSNTNPTGSDADKMSSLLSFLPRDKQHEPSSAPLPKDQDSTAARPMSLNLADSDGAVESSCTGDLSPGPSSAPPDMQWSPTGLPVEIKGDKKASENGQYEADSFNVSRPKTFESDTPTMLPAAETSREVEAVQITTEPSLPPPSLTLTGGFNGLSGRRQAPRKLPLREDAPYSIRPQLARVGLHHIMSPDMPQTPSLLSPRAAEFTASPFHRTAAGDLAGSSVFEQARISPKAKEDDPRSPAPMGEAPITRSIFDMF